MILRKGYNDLGSGSDELVDRHSDSDVYEQLEHELKWELYETIEVVTHFGPLTGTLVAVEEDYLVLVDSTGSVVLVPYYNIEFVSIV